MAFKIMADNLQEISAKQDGALYNVALNDQDFIIGGLGDEMALSYIGLDVSVGSGEAIVHGRHITSESVNSITLPSNESGYLVLRVDLSQAIGNEARLFATPTLTFEEINWQGTIYDFPLATFTTQTTTISSFVDERKIKGDVGTDLIIGTLLSGQTSITLNSPRINDNSVLSFFTDVYGVSPSEVSVTSGSVTLTFGSRPSNMVVGVKVEGTY